MGSDLWAQLRPAASRCITPPAACPLVQGPQRPPSPFRTLGGHIYLEIHIYICTYTHKTVFSPITALLQHLKGRRNCRAPLGAGSQSHGQAGLAAMSSLPQCPCPYNPAPSYLHSRSARGYQSILTADPSKQMARISLHPPKGFRRNSPYEEYLRFVFSPKSTKREFNGNIKRLAPSKDPPLAHGPCPVVMLGCSEAQCPTRGTALAGTAEDGEPTRRMSGRVKCCSCQGKLVQLG